MNRKAWIAAALIALAPTASMAEEIRGRLDAVSFSEGTIEVNGVVYDVITDETRVVYRGERMGEEDLRPGDNVVLILGNKRESDDKQPLVSVQLMRSNKGGLES